MEKISKMIVLCLLVWILALVNGSSDVDKPLPTFTRTEIRVSKSLNPNDMETLNVVTKDGNIAQLIVKKRDSKTSQIYQPQVQNMDKSSNQLSRAIYSNWLPVSSLYYHPNIIRLDTLLRNSTQNNQPKGNIIDSDRIPNVPNPVTIKSGDVYVKNVDKKRGRSVMQVDEDGIPVIHGVRVADDVSDRQTWRNARVINGELVPYEQGYKPPAAVSIGELIYASQAQTHHQYDNSGRFVKQDNVNDPQKGYGPFSVGDNTRSSEKAVPKENEDRNRGYVKFNSQSGLGPFTKADNSKKFIDYIKQINEQELTKRDYYGRRYHRSYENNGQPQQQMERRMLQYSGSNHYPNSLLYTPTNKLSPVTFNEGVRTPVLQYAHPELGVQPAKVTPEVKEIFQQQQSNVSDDDDDKEEEIDSGRQHNMQNVDYYRKDVMNYPYNTYYYKPKRSSTNQPFWIRISESIKDNVQSGFARMHQLTRPVFDPLVEATQKISHNLGFGNNNGNSYYHSQKAQNKFGLAGPAATALGGSSVILPALGLVAGGAALGLGAAAMGRFLNPLEMRSLSNQNRDILLIMEDSSNGNENGVVGHKRFRRNTVDDEYYMQQLVNNVERDNGLGHLSAPHFWSDTPCSKKIFCQVMVHQNPDEIVFMEKKMDSLMSTLHSDIANAVSPHLQDVMDAVKARDCTKFLCANKLP